MTQLLQACLWGLSVALYTEVASLRASQEWPAGREHSKSPSESNAI
jgi:hypothetical protein